MSSKCWYSAQGDFTCTDSRMHDLITPLYYDYALREQFTILNPAYISPQTRGNACKERLSYGNILPATESEIRGREQQGLSGYMFQN